MNDSYSSYKYCLVPKCKSTSIKTPDKLFFYVPKDPSKRKNWIKAMKREDVSNKATHYCCEDHFVLQNDMDNYWQWFLTKNVKQLRLKPGVVPHRYDCRRTNTAPIERNKVVKKRSVSNLDYFLQKDSSANRNTPDISQSNVSSDDYFLEKASATLVDKIKEEPIFEDPEEEQCSTRSSNPEPSTSHIELQTHKKRRKMVDECGTSCLNESTEEKELTTDDHFTNYVNATLKSFKNIKHKEQCKAAISNILTEYLFKGEE